MVTIVKIQEQVITMGLEGTSVVTTMLSKDGIVHIIVKISERPKTEMFVTIWRKDTVSNHFISTQNMQFMDTWSIDQPVKKSKNIWFVYPIEYLVRHLQYVASEEKNKTTYTYSM